MCYSEAAQMCSLHHRVTMSDVSFLRCCNSMQPQLCTKLGGEITSAVQLTGITVAVQLTCNTRALQLICITSVVQLQIEQPFAQRNVRTE